MNINLKNRLNEIFIFLNENRKYNHQLQSRTYFSLIKSFSKTEDKVVALLYEIANTQSQPKIDKLANFYKSIFKDLKCMSSMESFVHQINPNQPKNFNSLYNGMKMQDGWGEKTSALLTKIVYQIHNGKYSDQLKIWKDVPNKVDLDDDFYLPVDSVIIAIFTKLDNSTKWNFDKINKTLKQEYKGEQIEVWDDLWFWGFITQHGTGINRKFEWNENKYWSIPFSDKNNDIIEEIHKKSEEFLQILNI